MDQLLHFGLSNALLATFLALVAASASTIWRRPALAHGLWLLVLLKLVTPPLVPISVPRWQETVAEPPARAEAAAQSAVNEEDGLAAAEPADPASAEELALTVIGLSPGTSGPAPASVVPEPTSERTAFLALDWFVPALLAVWLAGSVGWFALALCRIGQFQLLLRHAVPAPAALQQRAQRLARRVGLFECPEVLLIPGSLSPMLWVLLGAPRLVLPRELMARLNADQQATLLVHELAHLRRRDHWVRCLEMLATGLYWWHPVVWWAKHELHEAEEQCCDAWVVWALPRAARAYATALLETVDFLSEVRPALPPVASGVGQVTILKRRLTMIMQAKTPRALSWFGTLALMGLGAVWLPTWVQADPPQAEREQLIREIRELLDDVKKAGDEGEAQEKIERLLKQKTEKIREQAKKTGEQAIKRIEVNPKFKDGKLEVQIEAILDEKGILGKAQLDAFKKLKDLKVMEIDVQVADQLKKELSKQLVAAGDDDTRKLLEQIKALIEKEEAKNKGKAAKEKAKDKEKAKEKGKDSSGKSANPEDVERARMELKEAEAQMKQAQQQIQAAARRIAEAHRKLAALGSQSGRRTVIEFEKKDTQGKPRIMSIKPDVRVIKPETKDQPSQKIERRIEVVVPSMKPQAPVPPTQPKLPGASNKAGANEKDRINDLEQKLSDLLREVRSLRNEMRQQERERDRRRQ